MPDLPEFAPIAPPPRHRLADQIAETIERRIASGALGPGAALPPERDLAGQLGVSRPSVREALTQLTARGLIEPRRGGGHSVRDLSGPMLAEPLHDLVARQPQALADVLELRLAIETVAATLAAERADDADLARIAALLEALAEARAAGDRDRAAACDAAFHLAVAEAARNVALLHVMRGLYGLIEASTRSCQAEPDGAEIDRQHRAILAALRARDPAAARRAAEAHLDHARRLGIGLSEP